jgi:hypothetical protein
MVRLSYVPPFLAAPFLVIGAAPFLCPWRHTTFGVALQRFEDVADSAHPTAAPGAGWSTCMSMLPGGWRCATDWVGIALVFVGIYLASGGPLPSWAQREAREAFIATAAPRCHGRENIGLGQRRRSCARSREPASPQQADDPPAQLMVSSVPSTDLCRPSIRPARP